MASDRPMAEATSSSGTEHTECAVCGYEPDPERVPPHYVFSLSDEDTDDGFVRSYPFGDFLSVPFACSDECWLDAQDDPELVTGGGTDTSDTERLTPELVSTKEVTSQEDIPEFLSSLEVPVHNRWVDLRSKELGAFDYEPVELVVSYEFRSVDDADRGERQ